MSEDKVQVPLWAAKIQEARKSKGITQEQLAKIVGTSQSTITDWERGRTFPRSRNLFVLCKALGINIKQEVEVDMKEMSKMKSKNNRFSVEFQNLQKSNQLNIFIERFVILTKDYCAKNGMNFPIEDFSREVVLIWMKVNDPVKGVGASALELRLEDEMKNFLFALDARYRKNPVSV